MLFIAVMAIDSSLPIPSFYGNRDRESLGNRKRNTRFVAVNNSDAGLIARLLHHGLGDNDNLRSPIVSSFL
jgi:hypothetical protein